MYVASNGIKTAVILLDDQPTSPREYNDLSHMICWHRRYNLGDKHNYDDSQEFAEALAKEHLKIRDVFSAVKDGLLSGYRLFEVESAMVNGKQIGPHYQLEHGSINPRNEVWVSTPWRCTRELDFITSGLQDFETLLESFITSDLLKLLDASNEVLIKPLFLYDHSVQSISTGSFVGRAQHADWDSGQVGFVYMTKDEALKNLSDVADTMRIGMVFAEHQQDPIKVYANPNMKDPDLSVVMEDEGFQLVSDPALIRNLYGPTAFDERLCAEPLIDPEKIRRGEIFALNSRLYEFDGWSEDGSHVLLHSIASYNPDLKALTEDRWKERAGEIMEAQVKEYDCYLQGEVYGYQQYEGLDEVDSCWGFNPGGEEICDVIKSEMFGWWEPGMEFRYEGGEIFDIEEFYEENDFPELRARILDDVKNFVTFESETSRVFPFAMSAEDILANKDDVLTQIVSDIYDAHEEWDTERIYSTTQEYAGVSRALQVRISREDLEPDRDYTEAELTDIFVKKASLADQIAGAAARQGNQLKAQPQKDLGPDR